VVCVALAGCFSPDGSDPDAGDPAGQDAATGDGGGARDGGGRPGDGGRDSGFHLPDARMSFDAGAALDGGGAAICNLPADTGPCDAAISRWAWNPGVGACELFSYGGCEGNANNFATPSECLQVCANVQDASAGFNTACKVGDQVFPSGGQGSIQDPHSCNTCSCIDGQLACTEIGCSQECPPNAAPSTSCEACGPADGCDILQHGCFVVCSDSSACVGTEFSSCIGGLCRNLCG
jgi:hypothetical protein